MPPAACPCILNCRSHAFGVLLKELTHLYVEVAGPAALRLSLQAENDIDDIAPDWAGLATATYLNNRKVTIYGGTSEVQHNILAKAVLGL